MTVAASAAAAWNKLYSLLTVVLLGGNGGHDITCQGDALKLLYHRLGEPDVLTAPSHWHEPKKYCDLNWVKCDKHRRHVKELDISSRRINVKLHQLTDALRGLPHLEMLYVKVSLLKYSYLPPEWSELQSLQSIQLEGNNIGGTLPPEWGRLRHLKHLYLDANELTGTLPHEWSALRKLQDLQLQRNRLKGTLPASWGSLKNLRFLDMSLNANLSGSLPYAWAHMRGLDQCFVGGTHVCGRIPAALKDKLFTEYYRSTHIHKLPQCAARDAASA